MSGSPGDGDGAVWVAHAWVPREHRAATVGPWHWWNVYKDEPTAQAQVARQAAFGGWKGLAETAVTKLTHGGT